MKIRFTGRRTVTLQFISVGNGVKQWQQTHVLIA